MLKKVSYRDIARFTWHYWGRQKGKLALVAVMTAMGSAIDVMFPVIMASWWMPLPKRRTIRACYGRV
ncbi:MAG: hypothetical protein LRZ85_07880 [Alphaproteobacteria bacterium]|nr:hypothetical protein [Alphaproteobacteria bacterium]MCD8570457.1 hypothetical protein [Alphaproteobacteria bacterium]